MKLLIFHTGSARWTDPNPEGRYSLSPYITLALVPVMMGIALVPWSIALKGMSNGEFFVYLGIVFVVLGGAQMMWSGLSDRPSSGRAAALLAGVLYVGAIWMFNGVISTHINLKGTIKMSMAAAFISVYAIPAAIAESVWLHRMLTPLQWLFMLVVVGGLVGFILTGKD